MLIVNTGLAQYSWLMVKKKETKPPIPETYRKATTLWLTRRRIHKHKTKYATLWEASKDFTRTKLFKKITKHIKKQMIAKHSEGYYQRFLEDEQKQIKFVLNMFRHLKKFEEDYFTPWPKSLHQDEQSGFTPPKWIIAMGKDVGKDGKALPNRTRQQYAKFKRANKKPLADRLKEKKELQNFYKKN